MTYQYKFIFYIAKNYSIPIFKPLVKLLQQRNQSVRFYVSDKILHNFPKEWQREKVLANLQEAKRYNADFVLVSGNFVDFRIPGIKVQLFHGLGVEKEAHFKLRHFFDVYLTSGPYVTEKFEKLQLKYGYFIVRETGWPKIDYIINYPLSNDDQIKIPANKKCILYAPTFSTDHQSASSLINKIPQIIKEDEIWFVKFHELMSKEIVAQYRMIDPDKVKVLQNIEITPYLHAADVLISDTSSVVYEFMVLDKPIITYKTMGAKDKGIDITDANELRNAVDRCLAHPNEYKKNRIKHIKRVNPYINGEIALKVFNELTDIKNKNALPKKPKPLNLIRKFQILYHSVFKKGYLR